MVAVVVGEGVGEVGEEEVAAVARSADDYMVDCIGKEFADVADLEAAVAGVEVGRPYDCSFLDSLLSLWVLH